MKEGTALLTARDLMTEFAHATGLVGKLMAYVSFGEAVEAFWLEDAHRKAETWMAHRDINMVMLATTLMPGTYLSI